MNRKKVFLGKNTYVFFDGHELHLSVEESFRATDSISLDPDMYNALCQYVTQLGVHPSPPERVLREVR